MTTNHNALSNEEAAQMLRRIATEFSSVLELTVRAEEALRMGAKALLAMHETPEALTCLRCGHENWLQNGKAPCQIIPPAAPQYQGDSNEH